MSYTADRQSAADGRHGNLRETSSVRMKVNWCQHENDGKRWEEFVDRQIQGTYCHRWKWKQVIENSFGWPTYYLMAEDDSRIRGVLPLVWQRSWFFGSFLSSLPFLNAGGILGRRNSLNKPCCRQRSMCRKVFMPIIWNCATGKTW